MQKNSPDIFSEKDLNKLLNRSFLELYVDNTKSEGIIEAISIQTFGLKDRSFFIQKLIGKISLQVIFYFLLIIGGGITTITLLKNQTKQKKESNRPYIIRNKGQNISNSKIENKQKDNIFKSNSLARQTNMYKKNIESYSTSEQISSIDSIKNSSAIQEPAAINFNESPLLFPKSSDSVCADYNSIKKTESKNNRQVKRKTKPKWREHEVK